MTKWFYLLPILFYVVPAGLTLVVTAIVGAWVNRRRWAELLEAERAFASRRETGLKSVPDSTRIADACLALGNSTVSPGYHGRWMARLRSWFGGELAGITRMTDLARREAILRMKQSVPDADTYLNCKIDTSFVIDPRGGGILCVEISASATALRHYP